MNWENENVLITGATSGLGKALSYKFGELGSQVIMLSKNIDELQKMKKEIKNSIYVHFDLENIDKISEMCAEIEKVLGKSPSILINCVGYQVIGLVSKIPLEIYEKNYKVNTLAPIALIQRLLPNMLKTKGTIINIYSSIMYHAYPGKSSYCATKKALQAIHESLKLELFGTNVKTICVRPGSMKTNYWKNSQNLMNNYTPPIAFGKDPKIVADKIVGAIEKHKDEVDLSTLKDKIGYHLSYWCPKLLEKVILRSNKTFIEDVE